MNVHPTQNHKRHHMPDMKRRGRWINSTVYPHSLVCQQMVQLVPTTVQGQLPSTLVKSVRKYPTIWFT